MGYAKSEEEEEKQGEIEETQHDIKSSDCVIDVAEESKSSNQTENIQHHIKSNCAIDVAEDSVSLANINSQLENDLYTATISGLYIQDPEQKVQSVSHTSDKLSKSDEIDQEVTKNSSTSTMIVIEEPSQQSEQ